jgi:hypothetical protein
MTQLIKKTYKPNAIFKASEALMLSARAIDNDMCIRTDTNTVWLCTDTPSNILANWYQLPTGTVSGDYATQTELDNEIAFRVSGDNTKVSKSGDVMSGNLTFSNGAKCELIMSGGEAIIDLNLYIKDGVYLFAEANHFNNPANFPESGYGVMFVRGSYFVIQDITMLNLNNWLRFSYDNGATWQPWSLINRKQVSDNPIDYTANRALNVTYTNTSLFDLQVYVTYNTAQSSDDNRKVEVNGVAVYKNYPLIINMMPVTYANERVSYNFTVPPNGTYKVFSELGLLSHWAEQTKLN